MADFGGGANDENVIGLFVAVVKSDLAVCFVGGEDDVGACVVEALGDANSPLEQATLMKFGFEHFRPNIVDIVDDLHAE